MVKKNEHERQIRLLARLVRELLREEKFDTLADLTDVLKYRCATLKIRWSNDAISEAYRLVESNTPLVTPDPRLMPRGPFDHTERPDPIVPISKAEAADILQRLFALRRRVS